MSPSSFAALFAQVTSSVPAAAAPAADAAAQQAPPAWTTFLYMILIFGVVYFALIRPQIQTKKKQEETIKSAKTGDKIITTSGIHGVITNVKETTVIVRVADNVKLEIEKSHVDKITRTEPDAEKTVAAKVS